MLEVFYRDEKFPEHRSFALTRAIGDSREPLIQSLKTAGPIDHAATLRNSEARYGTSAQPKMIELLKESKGEKDAKVRVWLQRAASRSADPASSSTLIRHLEDARPNVRRHAARLLGTLGDTQAQGRAWRRRRSRSLGQTAASPGRTKRAVRPQRQ